MLKYDPWRFTDLSETPLGKKIWKYLNEKDTVLVLKVTTKLGHPGVEGVGDELLEKFGDKLKEQRMKQMIGHMIRQVMDHHGYEVDSQGLKCRKQQLFSSGTRYKKRK